MPTILPSPGNRTRFFWPLLAAGLTAATLLPIGIHTVLLDDLGVPYPSALPHSGWTILPDHGLLVLGMIYLNRAVHSADGSRVTGPAAFIFLVVAALNQALLRLPIMRNAVSTKWTIYPFIDNLPAVLWFAAATVMVMLATRLTTTTWRRLTVAAALAVVLDLCVAPALDSAFTRIIAANTAREGQQLYNVPYDWHVDVPSYLTFLEPALGAVLIAMVLRQLRVGPAATATVLFALQGGPLARVVLNIWYAPLSPPVAMLSEGQFTLQALALAALASSLAVLLVPAREHHNSHNKHCES